MFVSQTESTRGKTDSCEGAVGDSCDYESKATPKLRELTPSNTHSMDWQPVSLIIDLIFFSTKYSTDLKWVCVERVLKP